MDVDDRFCPNCGSKVNQEPAKPLDPPSATNFASTETPPPPSNSQAGIPSSNTSPFPGHSVPPTTNQNYPSQPPNHYNPNPSVNPMLYQTPTQYPAYPPPLSINSFVGFNELPRMLKIALVLQYLSIAVVFGGIMLILFVLGAFFGAGESEVSTFLLVIGLFVFAIGVLVVYLTRRLQSRSSVSRALIGLYHGFSVGRFLLGFLSIGSVNSFDIGQIIFTAVSVFILYALFFDKETNNFFNGIGPPYSA